MHHHQAPINLLDFINPKMVDDCLLENKTRSSAIAEGPQNALVSRNLVVILFEKDCN